MNKTETETETKTEGCEHWDNCRRRRGISFEWRSMLVCVIYNNSYCSQHQHSVTGSSIQLFFIATKRNIDYYCFSVRFMIMIHGHDPRYCGSGEHHIMPLLRCQVKGGIVITIPHI